MFSMSKDSEFVPRGIAYLKDLWNSKTYEFSEGGGQACLSLSVSTNHCFFSISDRWEDTGSIFGRVQIADTIYIFSSPTILSNCCCIYRLRNISNIGQNTTWPGSQLLPCRNKHLCYGKTIAMPSFYLEFPDTSPSNNFCCRPLFTQTNYYCT